LPSVNKLHAELRDRGLEVVLINFREDPQLVKRIARERGYTAPILIDRSGDVTGRLYSVFGPPTAYLVDRRGQLVGRIVGGRNWAGPAARKLLLDLLAQPGG
jgi:hypothetical protein